MKTVKISIQAKPSKEERRRQRARQMADKIIRKYGPVFKRLAYE